MLLGSESGNQQCLVIGSLLILAVQVDYQKTSLLDRCHSTSTAEGHYAMRDTVKGIRCWLAVALPFEIIGCQAL